MNERGNTTLLMLMLVSALSLFCCFSLQYGKQQYVANYSRARAYLCMKQQLQVIHSYTQAMFYFNLSIKSAFAFSYLPPVKAMHKALQSLQQIYHFSFVHKLTSQGVCHFSQRVSFFYNLPYKHYGIVILKRAVDGSAIPNEIQQWSYVLSNFTGQYDEKPSFVLSAFVTFKDARFKLARTQEETIGAWSRSQLSSFSPSLPPWLQLPLKVIWN